MNNRDGIETGGARSPIYAYRYRRIHSKYWQMHALHHIHT